MVTLLGNLIPTPDTVLHHRYQQDGPDGPQWAAPVERAARIEHGEKRIQTADGRVVVLTATVFLLGHEGAVSVQDRLEWSGQTHTVEQLTAPTWWTGTVMHYEAGVT